MNFIRGCFSFLSGWGCPFAMQLTHTHQRTHQHTYFFFLFLLLLLALGAVGSLSPKIHNEETLTNCQHLERIFSWLWSNRYLYSEWGDQAPVMPDLNIYLVLT